MSVKYQERARILSQEQIREGIFSMWLEAPRIAAAAGPGQFISVYSQDRSRLLPRPISICEIGPDRTSLRLVYRIAGSGTAEFAAKSGGEELDLIGPLGNGYPIRREGGRSLLIGGGIGIPPLLELAKSLPGDKTAILGFRDQTFLLEDFARAGCRCLIATEDGSEGTKGTVLDCIRENGIVGERIYACGPTPMLRALQGYAADQGIECYLSLEERMACGIGACLACVCASTEVDEHSRVHNKRICAEGPVFRSDEIVLPQ